MIDLGHPSLRAIALLVSLVACGRSSAPDSGDAGALDAPVDDAPVDEVDAGLEIDAGADDAATVVEDPSVILGREYCAPLAVGICGARMACGCEAPSAGCEAPMREACERGAVEFADAVRRGELAIDREALARRIRHHRALLAACELPEFAPDFLVSPTPLGAPCSRDGACAAGDGACVAERCVVLPALGEACSGRCSHQLACVMGVCREGAEPGGSCATTRDCAPELRCVSGACRPRGESGAACSGSDTCGVGLLCTGGTCQPGSIGPCAGAEECGFGARCDFGTATACQPPLPVGASCGRDFLPCRDGLYCSAGRVCTRIPELGEACDTTCAEGLYCADEGRCVARIPEGATCFGTRRGEDPCEVGLFCGPGSTCSAFAAIGDVCEDVACASPARCDRSVTPARCVVSEVGGPCEGRAGCAPGARCDVASAICVRLRLSGEGCSTDYDCGIGLACVGAPGAASCAPPPVLGEPCGATSITPTSCATSLHCGLTDACRPAFCSGMPVL
jgi:hypothetical protein